MANYVLFLRDPADQLRDVSPSEIQAIIEKYMQWSARMREAGRLVGGEKLRDGAGRVMRRDGTSPAVTDGPYMEGKEVLGGYFILRANDYEEAVRLASDCPHLDFGTIEIREIEVLQSAS